MSRFGDLIGAVSSEETPIIDTAPSSLEPVVEEIEEKVIPKPLNLWNLSKDELEDYGRTIGIELDRRHNKSKLVKQLENYIDGL